MKNGKVQLGYISPESLLTNHQWRGTLASDVYRENLAANVVDEEHCVKQWYISCIVHHELYDSFITRIHEGVTDSEWILLDL